jgi:hypothetical protein
MATTTFSGPVRAGTVKENTGVNLGYMVLSQSYDSGNMTGLATGNYDVQLGTLPAGAQIVDITVDQVVAAGTGTTTFSVGTASGGAQLMAAVDSSAGGRFRGTATAATQLAWQIGTTDQAVWVRNVVGTGTLTAGRAVVTVTYVQK